MTAIPLFPDSTMDLSHLDDKMELGTSPYPHVDDIDFDFEPERQQSVDRSMVDDTENADANQDPIQADMEDMYNDDEMVDDENTLQEVFDNDLEDLNMESYDGQMFTNQDEEILYDEEEAGSVDMAGQPSSEKLVDTITQESSVQQEEGIFEDTTSQEKDTLEDPNFSNTNTMFENSHTNDPNGEQTTTQLDDTHTQVQESKHSDASTEVVDFATQDATRDHDTSTAAETLESVVGELTADPGTQQSFHEGQIAEEQSVQFPAQNEQGTAETAESRPENSLVDSATEDEEADQSIDSLHPVTVVYLGQEMSFFPPTVEETSATFFLSDSNLAYEPVEKLLASCRDILGETLEHDDELVLDIPSLGLHICEDSKYASQLTLSQVVDVYLNLSRNENPGMIEPLYCSLSSRVCLASQYAYLAASASEGKTYSQIAAEHLDSPEHGDNPVEEATEQPESHQAEPALSLESQNEDDSNLKHMQRSEEDRDHTHDQRLQEDEQDNSKGNGSSKDAHSLNVETTEADLRDHQSEKSERSSNTLTQPDQRSNLEEQPAAERFETTEPSGHREVDAYGAKIDQSAGPETLHEEPGADAQDDHDSVSSGTIEEELSVQTAEQLAPESGENPALDNNQEEIDNGARREPEMDNLVDGVFNEDNVSQPVNGHESQDGKDNFDSGDTSHIIQHDLLDEAQATTYDEDADYDQFNLEDEFESPAEQRQDSNGYEPSAQHDTTANAPITPSKHNGSKRKAEPEEDELDFLDFSTPEPKRTRAS